MIPELIVFDLDLTLWDCGGLWVDCTSPPYHRDSNDRVWDSAGREMRFYSDVPEILEKVTELGCQTALASRTDRPDWARDVLGLLGYGDQFDHEEIFPGSKLTHFANLKESTGINYEEMLFFDDENRNIVEVGSLGVKCVEIRSGLNFDAFEKGLKLFR